MARFEYVKTRREDVPKIPVKYEKLVRLGNNLKANPDVTITADGVTRPYRAREVTPD